MKDWVKKDGPPYQMVLVYDTEDFEAACTQAVEAGYVLDSWQITSSVSEYSKNPDLEFWVVFRKRDV